jgi:UDP-glucose 4-epimerase
VLDNLSTGNVSNIEKHIQNNALQFYEADIRDTARVAEIFDHVLPEVVFHLAAQVNVRHSIQDPHNCADINILGTINILDAMKKV